MKKQSSKAAVVALLVFAGFLVAAIALVVELLSLYVPGLWAAVSRGDENALRACLEGQNRLYSGGLLWLLSFIQVLSIVIPSLPIQLAAGMALGTWTAFAVTFTASVAAHMTAFAIACRAKKLLVCIAGDYPKVGKVLHSLSVPRNRTYYTVMLLLAPGLPNGAIPYAAANAGLKAWLYLAAVTVALPAPIWMICAAGDMALSGNLLSSAGLLGGMYALVALLWAVRNTLPQRLRRMGERWMAGMQKGKGSSRPGR